MRKDSLVRLEQHGIKRIPKGWTQSRVKYLGTYLNGYPFKPDDWGSVGRPILRIQDLSSTSSDPNRYDGELPDRYLIQSGDILISWSASLGVYRWAGEDAWLNQHIFKVAVDTTRVLDEFFVWLAEWFIREMDREVHGSTMQHLTADAFGSFPVLLPPLNKQAQIAERLMQETTRLDALVSAKEEMLELLSEKKRAFRTHVVTRGLNVQAPSRDSGVHWLGEIPAHWRIERARWLFSERDERSTTGEEELLTVSHLTGVTPRSQKDVTMFEAETTEGYKICQPGDLVINTLWAWMGAMGISPVKGIVSPAYNVYQPGPCLDSKFVDALVRIPIFAEEVTRYSKGVWSSRLRLYPEGFFEVLLPVPPLSEQREITSVLAKETMELDGLIVATERTILLLKERRAALVAAAVTGQAEMEEA
ncbi:MAG: restriction endonuclease subunit S [Anaerolineales bacterium]|nr:restriction endonuclease subunit S [Anaerolineales bacterium]